MNTKLNIKWGIWVKMITFVSLLLISFAEYYTIRLLFQSIDWITLAVAVIIPVVILYFAMESPVSIEIDNSKFILNKIRGKLMIDFDQISRIELYRPDASELRYFGSGGVFGFVGRFHNANIGKYKSYVGDWKQAFLIQTKTGENYVFSCDRRNFVVETIKKLIK
ncbi:MAG: PH domain-containing protein [Dysgonamonadaceae bacterium]|jgi:hypothetical protein|nr:PH domain-containing protein [Dysgonamonadaceae bacterium]